MAFCYQRPGKPFGFPHRRIMDLSFPFRLHSSHPLYRFVVSPPSDARTLSYSTVFSPIAFNTLPCKWMSAVCLYAAHPTS